MVALGDNHRGSIFLRVVLQSLLVAMNCDTHNQLFRGVVKFGAEVQSAPLKVVEMLIWHRATGRRGILVEPWVL